MALATRSDPISYGFNSGCTDTVMVVKEQSLEMQSVKIFPNPNNGSFQIQIEKSMKNGKIIFSNSMGQKVYEQKVMQGNNQIETNKFTKGLYYYTLFDDNQQIGCGKISIE